MADELDDQLKQLKPEARARVQEALKASLEKELVAGASTGALGNEAAAHSRGILFSRATATIRDIEQVVINQAAQLDDQQFDKFVGRLSQLKKQG